MLVQQQSVHSLDLTELDLDNEDAEEEEEEKKKKKEEEEKKKRSEEEEEEEVIGGDRTLQVNEFDQYLDLLEIF